MSAAVTDLIRAEMVHGMPFEEYITLDGIHATGLKEIQVSALHYYRKKQLGHDDKDALRVGRACHTATLEPDRFALEFAVWRSKDGRRGTNVHKAFCEANKGRTLLTELQYNTAIAVRNALRAHPVASKLLARCKPEVTARWTHQRTGRACVSRFDLLGDVLVDLKTTRNPAPNRFSGDAARLSYALQMGFYYDAALQVTGEALPVKIIAVQNVEPYDVVVYDIPDEVLRIGREQYEAAIDKLIACEASGKWPGMAPDEELELRLPSWASPEAEEELTFNGQALSSEAVG